MTLPEKLRVLAQWAEHGRNSDVYTELDIILRERPRPAYLGVVDDVLGSKDRPINLDERRAA